MWYFLKRLFSGILTVVLISVVVFFMFQIVPGDPVLSRLGSEEIDQNPQLAAKMYEAFNLHEPVHVRYGLWVSGMLRGDMGESFKYGGQAVNRLISDRLSDTIVLAVASMIVIVFVALPLGFFLAPRIEKRSGVLFNALSQLGLAMPIFWVAILLLYVFSMQLKVLPTRATINFARPAQTLRSIILPVITLSVGNISIVLRYMVSALNEASVQPFTQVARAKGLLDREVQRKHVFRHALIQVITILSMVFVGLITGSVLIENVFNIQGVGSLLINAIRDNDYPVVQGVIFYYAVVVVVINILLDFAYRIIDPRIDYAGR